MRWSVAEHRAVCAAAACRAQPDRPALGGRSDASGRQPCAGMLAGWQASGVARSRRPAASTAEMRRARRAAPRHGVMQAAPARSHGRAQTMLVTATHNDASESIRIAELGSAANMSKPRTGSGCMAAMAGQGPRACDETLTSLRRTAAHDQDRPDRAATLRELLANRQVGAVDIEAFAANLARMVEEGGKALAAYLKPREEGAGRRPASPTRSPTWSRRSAQVAEYWLSDPQRAVELQSRLGQAYLDLWARAGQAPGRRRRAAGRRARSERQALRRSGMVVEPVLRLPQAGLSAHHAAGPTTWSRTPTASTRTPGRRPSSTSGRSPTRSRRRTSC